MQTKTIEEISKMYDLGIDRIIKNIKKNKVRQVLLQFPEGLKPYSIAIADEVEERGGCECFIWLGDCFGGCDVPFEVEKLGVDLIVQFGHSDWLFRDNGIRVL